MVLETLASRCPTTCKAGSIFVLDVQRQMRARTEAHAVDRSSFRPLRSAKFGAAGGVPAVGPR